MSHCDVDHLRSNNNEHMLTWYINNMVWNIMAKLHYKFVMIYAIRLVYNMLIKYLLLNQHIIIKYYKYLINIIDKNI